MDESTSTTVTSVSSALAVLGAFGSLVNGACQPVAGPTFKLGATLMVHTACALSGRINDWDEYVGVAPLRNARAECYSVSNGRMKQMGSCVYAAVQDRAVAAVYALKPQDRVYQHYIRMTEDAHTGTYANIVRWIAACWPLVASAIMAWADMQLWAGNVLLGWLGWFFIVLSAGPAVQSGHQCNANCKQRVYLLNDQSTTKSLIEYTVCLEFDDLARRRLPKRHTRCRILRAVGSLLMTIHFPLGLVATCYDSSAGAQTWVLIQFVGLIAGMRWWCIEQRLARHGVDCAQGLTVTHEIQPFERWQAVLDRVDQIHWPHIKHQYTCLYPVLPSILSLPLPCSRLFPILPSILPFPLPCPFLYPVLASTLVQASQMPLYFSRSCTP
ncbi:hypothetical protein BC939DRAFT_472057 [Gamsiella multidivaricata]|uniref:uncharacterized protein n=1 Tax=Gamsiella multidivaricata TaxID=101098 RepID=UPI0022207B96|nr:uncharacterized protein BC939DRAFT_472057 [Gamsiella multidivaricata]KAI7815723.1 hypothetical protein BC939DRAFT_472057 [Gamsiella multidivaricata]